MHAHQEAWQQETSSVNTSWNIIFSSACFILLGEKKRVKNLVKEQKPFQTVT